MTEFIDPLRESLSQLKVGLERGMRVRVSDPHSFDPDPAFEVGDQSGSGSNPDSGL